MIAFIDTHRGPSGVEPICCVLQIAPSAYQAHVTQRADSGRLPDRLNLNLMKLQHHLLRTRLLSSLYVQLLQSRPILSISQD
jgi:hypothetical protein